jgi:hypothetical protein
MYEFSRMDAVVAERLSASPRIYDIYGACGIGIMAEYFPHGQIEQIALPEEKITMGKESDPLISHNDLSAMAKLKVSLHMAESLADLHGFPGGVIVHQDVVRSAMNSNLVRQSCTGVNAVLIFLFALFYSKSTNDEY